MKLKIMVDASGCSDAMLSRAEALSRLGIEVEVRKSSASLDYAGVPFPMATVSDEAGVRVREYGSEAVLALIEELANQPMARRPKAPATPVDVGSPAASRS